MEARSKRAGRGSWAEGRLINVWGVYQLYHYHQGVYHYITGVSLPSVYPVCALCPPSVPSVIGARTDPRIKRVWRKIKPISGCDLHLIVLSGPALVAQNGSIKTHGSRKKITLQVVSSS